VTDTSTPTVAQAASLPIDYTSRDYTELVADMQRRMRILVPGWDGHAGTFEMILLEQVAYVGDILNFYVDRMAAEAYIQSAVLRESVLNLAYAFGYVPTMQTASSVSLNITKVDGDSLTIPERTQFYGNWTSGTTNVQVIFESDDEVINAGAAGTTFSVPCHEGVTVIEELVGMSTGAERMVFPLAKLNVIQDSVIFYVADGPIDTSLPTPAPTKVAWVQIMRIIDADAGDRVFTVYVDENGGTRIRTGDGTTGRIPTPGAPCYATYRYGKGAYGNVAANTIKSLVTGGELARRIKTITNPAPATGGASAESLQSLRTNIPRSLRSLDRAVTLQDFADLAIQVPGVGKAAAGAVLNTNVTVSIHGVSGRVPDQALIDKTKAYLDERRMIGTTVTVVTATFKKFNVTISITVHQLYKQKDVVGLLKKVLTAYYSYANTDFGFESTVPDLYVVAKQVRGITKWNITQHYLQGDSAALNQEITLGYNEYPSPGTITINATGGIV